jgi:hypothetical protein
VKSEKVEDGDESGGRSCRGASGCSGRRIGDASTAPIHRGEGGAGSGEQIFRGSGRGPAGADFSPLSPLNFLSGLVWGTCWTCSKLTCMITRQYRWGKYQVKTHYILQI